MNDGSFPRGYNLPIKTYIYAINEQDGFFHEIVQFSSVTSTLCPSSYSHSPCHFAELIIRSLGLVLKF